MLIGLAGKAGVGKTTIANLLRDRRNFQVTSYAVPLKAALVEMTGLPLRYFTDIELKETTLGFGKTPRQLMQLFGTEFVREMVFEDFWIWRMQQFLEERANSVDGQLLWGDRHIVIDDCRFNNETKLVRDCGGVVVHLERKFKTPTDQTSHVSEQVLERLPQDVYINSGISSEDVTYDMLNQELRKSSW